MINSFVRSNLSKKTGSIVTALDPKAAKDQVQFLIFSYFLGVLANYNYKDFIWILFNATLRITLSLCIYFRKLSIANVTIIIVIWQVDICDTIPEPDRHQPPDTPSKYSTRMSRPVSIAASKSDKNLIKSFPDISSHQSINQEPVLEYERKSLDNNRTVKEVMDETSRSVTCEQQTSLFLQSIHHETDLMPDISWHEIVSSTKPNSRVERDSNPISTVEISDLHLKKILRQKQKNTSTRDENQHVDLFESVQIVSNLSCKLTNEILNSICNEILFDSDLISKLISSELKG